MRTANTHRVAAALATVAIAVLLVTPPLGHEAAGASCVRFVASIFDAPGNDNTNLNGEWVRIKNFCTSAKSLAGWTIHDYGKKHTYRFPSGVSIKPGATITLFSGKGANTATKRFWGMSGSAVWNNTPPEIAYLKNAAGTLQSKWTEP